LFQKRSPLLIAANTTNVEEEDNEQHNMYLSLEPNQHESKSDAAIEKKLHLISLEITLANRVFPVPGG
jgi:hypothetical protein